MIIGFAGKAGSGKSVSAAYLAANYGFRELAWAEPLKAMLAAAGFPEPANREDKEKKIQGFDFSWRQAAQHLGTGWGRALDPNIWVKALAQRMQQETLDRVALGFNQPHFVISDVRFENEADMIRSMGGLVIHITGRAADLGANASHASESGVMFYPLTDQLINNKGDLQYTYQQIDAIVKA